MLYRVAFSAQPTGKLPQGDPRWESFNTSFQNVEMDCTDIASQIYLGHAYTTWHKDRRKLDNFICGQHLALDFDTCDRRSSLDSLISEKFIRQYGAILHTTPSHKDDAPKARAIFLLDQPIHQPKNYRDASNALLWMFENESDAQCKDACRFFYGASGCELRMPSQVLPLEFVKFLIQDWKQALGQKRAEERRVQERAASRAPKQYAEPDAEAVREALQRIPTKMQYDEWLRVLMAIHSRYPGPEGIAMAEAWSPGQRGEIAAKWKSFKQQGNGGGAVTLNTVFHMANRLGR